MEFYNIILNIWLLYCLIIGSSNFCVSLDLHFSVSVISSGLTCNSFQTEENERKHQQELDQQRVTNQMEELKLAKLELQKEVDTQKTRLRLHMETQVGLTENSWTLLKNNLTYSVHVMSLSIPYYLFLIIVLLQLWRISPSCTKMTFLLHKSISVLHFVKYIRNTCLTSDWWWGKWPHFYTDIIKIYSILNWKTRHHDHCSDIVTVHNVMWVFVLEYYGKTILKGACTGGL